MTEHDEGWVDFYRRALIAEGHHPQCRMVLFSEVEACNCKRTRSYFDRKIGSQLPVLRMPGSNGLVARLTRQLHLNGLVHCCVTCGNWNEKNETCRLVDQRPPAEVIAYGCAAWVDLVPF
jgi:hypothetical protein